MCVVGVIVMGRLLPVWALLALAAGAEPCLPLTSSLSAWSVLTVVAAVKVEPGPEVRLQLRATREAVVHMVAGMEVGLEEEERCRRLKLRASGTLVARRMRLQLLAMLRQEVQAYQHTTAEELAWPFP